MKISALIAALLVAAAAPLCGALSTDGVHYQKGMSYFDKKNYPKALDRFLQQLDEDPADNNSKRMIKQIGTILLEQKKDGYFTEITSNMKQLDFLKAAEYALELMKLDPKDQKAKDLFAECMKKYEAIKIANFGAEKTELAGLFRAGQQAYGSGAYFTARKNLAEVAENPYASWFQKWMADRRLKKIQSYLTSVIAGELSVPLKSMHYARGLQYYIVGDVASSINEFEKSFSINPENSELPAVLEELRDSGSRSASAAAPGKKDLAKAKALITSGVKAFMAKNYKKAINDWKAAAKLDSSYETRIAKRVKKAEILLAAEMETEKDDLLDEVDSAVPEAPKKARPKSPEPAVETAAAEEEKPAPRAAPAAKKPPKAPVAAAKPKLSSDELRKLYNEGLQAYAIGNLDKAINLWTQVVENDPDNKRAAANLARAQREFKSR